MRYCSPWFHSDRSESGASRAALILLILGLAFSAFSLRADSVPTLREGDTLIETDLVNEDGAPLELVDTDRPTVATFVFTRCAAVEFCPRMNQRFQAIQKALLDADEPTDASEPEARLVSITLDPEYDRPDRLKEFGEAIDADPRVWRFATGSSEEIDRLTKAFRVYRDDSEGVLNHSLATFLVNREGEIEKIWRGNFWKADDALKALRP